MEKSFLCMTRSKGKINCVQFLQVYVLGFVFTAGQAGGFYKVIVSISLLTTNLCIMSFDSTDIIQNYYFKADESKSTEHKG